MTARSLPALALIVLLAACGGGQGDDQIAAADSLNRDLGMPPVDSSAVLNDLPAPDAATPPPAPPPAERPPVRPAPPPPAPAPAPAPVTPASSVLAAGTALELRSDREISSRTNKAGESFTATLAQAVTDANGRTVIPAGATVTLMIEALAPAENRGDSTGTLRLRATSVAFDGKSLDLSGRNTTVAYTLKGRGVTTGGAATVGAGAAAGAVAGRVLGGGARGTIIGGVIGAASGAAIAAETADRDVVIASGARIVIALSEALTVPRD